MVLRGACEELRELISLVGLVDELPVVDELCVEPLGQSDSGNRWEVARKKVMPAIRSPETSRSCSAHGSCPPSGPGLYCANAGDPFASMAMRRESRQPTPGPRHQLVMSRCVWSQSSYGGIDQVASSRSTDVSESMS